MVNLVYSTVLYSWKIFHLLQINEKNGNGWRRVSILFISIHGILKAGTVEEMRHCKKPHTQCFVSSEVTQKYLEISAP